MLTISQMSLQNAEFFQKKGFDISKDINEFQCIDKDLFTPLMFVAGLGGDTKREIIKELLTLRANVNLCDPNGHHALLRAIDNESSKTVKLLLNHPLSEPVINPNLVGKKRIIAPDQSPLTAIIQDTLDQGCGISGKLAGIFNALLDHKDIDVNFDCGIGTTPLGVFCWHLVRDEGDCEGILKKLLDRGANPNLKGYEDKEPIMCLLFRLVPWGIQEPGDDPDAGVISGEDAELAISYLFKSSFDVKLDVHITTETFAYHTPLMIAQAQGLTNLTTLILNEIRAQAIKHLKVLQMNESDTKILREKLTEFVEKHALYNQNNKERYLHAQTTLTEQVLKPVLSLLEPTKTLGQLGVSAVLSGEVTKAGFDIKKGFDQTFNEQTLMHYAADKQLKDLLWALMAQPNYPKTTKDLYRSLSFAFAHDNRAIVAPLLQILGFDHFKFVFIMAVKSGSAEIIRYFFRIYENNGGFDKLKFVLFDQFENIRTILPQALQINKVPKHLLMKHFAQCLLRDTFAEECKQFKETTESKMNSENAEITKQEPLMTHKIKEVLLSRAQRYFGDKFQNHRAFVDETIKAICEQSDTVAKIMFNTGMHKTILFRYRAPIRTSEGIIIGLTEEVKKRRDLPVDAIQCIFSYLDTNDARKVGKIPFVFENIAIRKAIAFNPSSSAPAKKASNKRPFEQSTHSEHQSSQSADGKSSKKPKL